MIKELPEVAGKTIAAYYRRMGLITQLIRSVLELLAMKKYPGFIILTDSTKQCEDLLDQARKICEAQKLPYTLELSGGPTLWVRGHIDGVMRFMARDSLHAEKYEGVKWPVLRACGPMRYEDWKMMEQHNTCLGW